jgi:hypothetical protein
MKLSFLERKGAGLFSFEDIHFSAFTRRHKLMAFVILKTTASE